MENPTPQSWLSPRTMAICILGLLIAQGIQLMLYVFPPKKSGNSASALTPDQSAAPLIPRGDLAADEQTTISLFSQVSPSIVHITTNTLARSRFNRNVTEIPSGTGSGFVWDIEGHVVTNFHVIKDADTANVALADHSSWPAELVGIAPDKDIAVLKVEAPKELLKPVIVGTSSDIRVGQKTFVIGNPFGLDQTLTTGVVSALGREIDSVTNRKIQDVIQTDAAINPGNSGGPLIDSAGRVIGITTAIFSPSGAYAGIGFAIPIDTVRRYVPELIEHGRVIQPSLAITITRTDQFGVAGVLVVDVEPSSSAEAAGLRPTMRDRFGRLVLGDIITHVDDQTITNPDELLAIFEKHQVGDTVTLTVMRGNKTETLTVRLEESR